MDELRKRNVANPTAGETTVEIAYALDEDLNTVCDVDKIHDETGGISKRRRGRGPRHFLPVQCSYVH